MRAKRDNPFTKVLDSSALPPRNDNGDVSSTQLREFRFAKLAVAQRPVIASRMAAKQSTICMNRFAPLAKITKTRTTINFIIKY